MESRENQARPTWGRVWTALLLGATLGLGPWLLADAQARPEAPPPSPPRVVISIPLEKGTLLAAKKRDYQDLSPDEKAKLKKKWQSLPPAKREEYRRRMERFNKLPDDERQLFRRRHQQLQKLSPKERQRLQRQLDQWDQLSPQEREKIRRRFINQLYIPGPGDRPKIVG